MKSCCVDVFSRQFFRDFGYINTFNQPLGNLTNRNDSFDTLDNFRNHTIKYCILPSPPFPSQISLSKNHFIANDPHNDDHGIGLETPSSKIAMTKLQLSSTSSAKNDNIDTDAISERHWFSQMNNDLKNLSFYGDDLKSQLVRFNTNGTCKNFSKYNIIKEKKVSVDCKYWISDSKSSGISTGKKLSRQKQSVKIIRQSRLVDWDK
jgi:hypothetical protein